MKKIWISYITFMAFRHRGIEKRYRRVHDKGGILSKIAAQLYLILLNIEFYVFRNHTLHEIPELITNLTDENIYLLQEKKMEKLARIDFTSLLKKLTQYDLISFDIFDTLLFRPFDNPSDLFWIIEKQTQIFDFYHIRKDAEKKARKIHLKKSGNSEVSLGEIYQLVSRKTGTELAEKCCKLELELEEKLCFINPGMLSVYQMLLKEGKTVVITSDMYLNRTYLEQLLKRNGVEGYEKLYVSSEYGKSKSEGDLFQVLKSDFPEIASIIHIGDNPESDWKKATDSGIEGVLINEKGGYNGFA